MLGAENSKCLMLHDSSNCCSEQKCSEQKHCFEQNCLEQKHCSEQYCLEQKHCSGQNCSEHKHCPEQCFCSKQFCSEKCFCSKQFCSTKSTNGGEPGQWAEKSILTSSFAAPLPQNDPLDLFDIIYYTLSKSLLAVGPCASYRQWTSATRSLYKV